MNRKNLLKTIFVRLALERGIKDDADEWIVPALQDVLALNNIIPDWRPHDWEEILEKRTRTRTTTSREVNDKGWGSDKRE